MPWCGCALLRKVTTFTARQSTAENHPLVDAGPAVEGVVRPLLQAGGLGSVTLRTPGQDLAVQVGGGRGGPGQDLAVQVRRGGAGHGGMGRWR